MTATDDEINRRLTELVRGKWDESKCRGCGDERTARQRNNHCGPRWCHNRYERLDRIPPHQRADRPIDFESAEGFVRLLEWLGVQRVSFVRVSFIPDDAADPKPWCATVQIKHRECFKAAASPAIALRSAVIEALDRGLIGGE